MWADAATSAHIARISFFVIENLGAMRYNNIIIFSRFRVVGAAFGRRKQGVLQ